MSDYKELILFVEGLSDARFFEEIIIEQYSNQFNHIFVRPYARKVRKDRDFMNNVMVIPHMDHIIFSDLNDCPCCPQKRFEIENIINLKVKIRIVVVEPEIEAWLLAGINQNISKKLKIPYIKDTNNIKKEDFIKMISKRFDSKLDAELEILKYFDIDLAKQRNTSFKYFWNKYVKYRQSTFRT